MVQQFQVKEVLADFSAEDQGADQAAKAVCQQAKGRGHFPDFFQAGGAACRDLPCNQAYYKNGSAAFFCQISGRSEGILFGTE